jgi:hypothetical protein
MAEYASRKSSKKLAPLPGVSDLDCGKSSIDVI